MSGAQDTRQALLTAAAAEFLEVGYAAASMSRIAGRLGQTKGALAYHFPAKSHLATALLVRFDGEQDRAQQRAEARFEASGTRAALHFLHLLRAGILQDLTLEAAMVLHLDRSVPVTAPCRWPDRLRPMLQRAIGQGELPTGLPDHLAADFLAAVLASPWAPSRTAALPEWSVRAALRGIGLPEHLVDGVVRDATAEMRSGPVPGGGTRPEQ